MVSFRKSLMVVALLALCAGMAMAQCTTNAGTSVLRQEGVAEPIAPITVTCDDTIAGALQTGHYRITLNAPTGSFFTSRPGVAANHSDSEVQLTGGVTSPVPGVIAPTGAFVTFTPVDLLATQNGAGVQRFVFIISGLRVNASLLPPSTGTTPVALTINATATAVGGPIGLFAGAPSFTIANAAYVMSTFNFAVLYPGASAAGTELAFSQCNPADANLATPTATAPATPAFPLGFYLNFTEGFSNSFQKQADENSNGAVLATQGTRFAVIFSALPTNTQLWVPISSTGFKGTPTFNTITATLVQGAKADGSGGTLATHATVPLDWVPVTPGTAVVYEVTSADANVTESLTIPVSVAYTGTPSLAPATAGTVTASYAPISADPGPSQTAPLPRFAGTPKSAGGLYGVTACSTTLLFPYVTTQPGWNVGLSIANTGSDPFGNTGQGGTCAFSFYGAAGAPAAPVNFGSKGFGDTSAIAGGTAAADLASVAIGAGTSFQGYAIAICNFQYAHGYAFIIGNSGSSSLSNGYLALVLQNSTPLVRSGLGGQYESVGN